MAIIKVLKRKDGASLVIGVAVGLIVSAFATQVVADLSQRISSWGAGTAYTGQGWRVAYLLPAVTMILALVALEILIWVYVYLHEALNQK